MPGKPYAVALAAVTPFVEQAKQTSLNLGSVWSAVEFWKALRDASSKEIRRIMADHQANVAAAEELAEKLKAAPDGNLVPMPEMPEGEPLYVFTPKGVKIAPPAKVGSLKDRVAARGK